MSKPIPLLVASLLLAAGCLVPQPQYREPERPPVVACDACQTIWVGSPNPGADIWRFEQPWEASPIEEGPVATNECADCASAVQNFGPVYGGTPARPVVLV